jgi:hypothetical protein
MDPFSVIGVVASIVTFVDVGYKVLAEYKRLEGSVGGATAENENIESLTTRLQSVSLDLQPGKPESSMTADEFRLNGLAKECDGVSAELLLLLEDLKAKDPKSRRQRIRTSFQAVLKKGERDRLTARLDKCQQLLHLQLSQTARCVLSQRVIIIEGHILMFSPGSKSSADLMRYRSPACAQKKKFIHSAATSKNSAIP